MQWLIIGGATLAGVGLRSIMNWWSGLSGSADEGEGGGTNEGFFQSLDRKLGLTGLIALGIGLVLFFRGKK